MNRAELHQKQKDLKENPEFQKDCLELHRLADDKMWKTRKHELEKKWEIKNFFPTSFSYDRGKRAREKVIPSKKSSGKYIPLEKFYLARRDGIHEDDPIEVKQDYANYMRYRKERGKWEIPIPPKTLARLEESSRNGKTSDLYRELTSLITPWAKAHPELMDELIKPRRFFLRPGEKLEDLNSLRKMIRSLEEGGLDSLRMMAKPLEKGGLGLPFKKGRGNLYPFGRYFLTTNIMLQMYGVRPGVFEAALNHMMPEVFATYQSRMNQLSARKEDLERDLKGNLNRGLQIDLAQEKKLDQAVNKVTEALFEYKKIIEKLAQGVAWEIENIQQYLHRCLMNLAIRIWRKEHRREREEIVFSELEEELRPNDEDGEGEYDVETALFQASEKYREETSNIAKKIESTIYVKEILAPLRGKEKENAVLLIGEIPQLERSKMLNVTVRTIGRWDKKLENYIRERIKGT